MGDSWSDADGDPYNTWKHRSPLGFPTDDEGDEEVSLRYQYEAERRLRVEAERRLANSRSNAQSLVEATVKALMDNLPKSVTSPASTMPTSATVVPVRRYMRMPIVGTPGAPLMFTGTDGRALLPFFATLEKCFQAAGVQSGAEKVAFVPDYVHERLKEWVEFLDGYEKGDYDQLKREIYEGFGNPQNRPRYRREDLLAVIEEQRTRPLRTREELYLRAVHFETIANPLLEAGQVTDIEVNKAYFRTLPHAIGVKAHSRLKNLHPTYDTENEPFPRAWMKEAVKRELGKDWFEVQERGDPRPLTQRMAEIERQAAANNSGSADPPLEELLQNMSLMSIHDTIYAQSYAILSRAYPFALRLCPAPAPKVVATIPSALPTRPRPPELNQNAPPKPILTRAAQPPPTDQIDPCYYCWETGHWMGTCFDIWMDENRGWIKREDSRVIFKDGSQLQRFSRGLREDVLRRIDAEQRYNSPFQPLVETTPYPAGSFLFRVEDVWKDEVPRREVWEPTRRVPYSYAELEEDVWVQVDEEERKEVGQLMEAVETDEVGNGSATHTNVVAVDDRSDAQTSIAREAVGPHQHGHPYRRGQSQSLPSVCQGPTTTMVPDAEEEKASIQERIAPPPYQRQPMPQPTVQTPESRVTISQPPRVTGKGKEVEAPIEDKEANFPAVPKQVPPTTRITTDIEEMAGLSVSLRNVLVEAPPEKRDRYLYKEAPAESILAQPWICGHVVVAIDDVDPYKKPIQDFVDPSIQVSSMVHGDASLEGSTATAATCMVAPMTVYQGVPNIITSGGYEKSNADIEGRTGNGDAGGEIAVLEKRNEFVWTTGGGKTECAVFGKVPTIEAAELLRGIDEVRAKLVVDRAMSAAYKKVDKKEWPVPEMTLEEARTRTRFLSNLLDVLPAVPYTPPPFKDGEHSTREWLNNTNINLTGFLKAEEIFIFKRTLLQIKQVSTLDLSEIGRFKDTYLLDYKIATLRHAFWAKENVLVPSSMKAAKQLLYGVWWLALATKDGGVRVMYNQGTPETLGVLARRLLESIPYPAVVFESPVAVFYLNLSLATVVDMLLHAPVYVPKMLANICDRSSSRVKSVTEERQAATDVQSFALGDPEGYDRHRCILLKGSSKQTTFPLGSIAMSTTSWHNLGVGMHTGYLACWQIYEARGK